MNNSAPKFFTLVLAVVFLSLSASAQTVSKLADLTAGQIHNPGSPNDGDGFGPNLPQCRFTLVGTNLWFTSNSGGKDGAGGVFSFDLSNSNVTQLATLDNNTGKTPWASSVVLANGKGWFLTSLGGTGNRGTLCSIDLTNYAVNNVYSCPASTASGGNPRSTPVLIGDELWFTCSSGGPATYGTITKYNLTNGVATDVFTLNVTNTGRQPLGCSLVQVSNAVLGNAYYYLTLAGGTNIPSGSPNGAGLLSKITFNELNQPVVTNMVHLPGFNVAAPAGDPVFDGTNFLYFTTVGSGTTGGALLRFNLTNNALTTLFTFSNNATSWGTNFGYRPYGTPVLYNNELFFTTMGGGAAGNGTIGKLTLSNNVVTKLANLEGMTGLALGANPQYNGGTIYTNPATGRASIYFPINKGGLNNLGTIVRVYWPAMPIVASLSHDSGAVQLSWTGGYAPYSVDANFSTFTGEWTTNWLGVLTTNSVTVPATNSNAFFRIQGAAE